MRAAAGGMAEFFDLRRQRAATGASAAAEVGATQGLPGRDPGQPAPVDCRIALRGGRVEQVAVLDEQQRLDQHWRDGLEVGVLQARILAVVERLVVAIEDAQAGP